MHYRLSELSSTFPSFKENNINITPLYNEDRIQNYLDSTEMYVLYSLLLHMSGSSILLHVTCNSIRNI